MNSYLSSLLTSTTSRYNNLRRSLLSDETDGDTESDSHISRVLRAYYVEKGRPFPPWLPSDNPGGQQQLQPSYSYGQSQRQQPAQYQQPRRGGGLSDLFDSPSQTTQPQQPMSLRNRGPAPDSRGTSYSGSGSSFSEPPAIQQQQTRPGPGIARRPVAGPRDASYQSMSSQRSGQSTPPPPQPGAAGSGTAQDKLKAKLWGGRSTPS